MDVCSNVALYPFARRNSFETYEKYYQFPAIFNSKFSGQEADRGDGGGLEAIAYVCLWPRPHASAIRRLNLRTIRLDRRPRPGSASGEFVMASTGPHPAASMLFRIVDVPAGRYP